MPAAHPAIALAADSLEAAAPWIRAGAAIALSLVVVGFVRYAFERRARHLAAAVLKGGITQEVDTRLRFVQRLVSASIIALGGAIALSQFARVEDLADKLLASGAIVAAIVGFAARQTLANAVAGVMLAITQPVRVGDWVRFEEDYGVVEDVTLNFTILRAGDQRIVIPNERIASGVLRNDTLHSALVSVDVSVWLPPEADAGRAVAALEDETGGDVSVAEVVPWGVRLAVASEPAAPADRWSRETELRGRCLARLRAEGLLAAGRSAPDRGEPPL